MTSSDVAGIALRIWLIMVARLGSSTSSTSSSQSECGLGDGGADGDGRYDGDAQMLNREDGHNMASLDNTGMYEIEGEHQITKQKGVKPY